MMKIIRLEKNKVKLKLYIGISTLVSFGILIFLFFFAGISYIKPDDVLQDNILGTYNFIYMMGLLIGIVAYSIQSSIIFSKIVLEEYKNDGLYLLFSYPINRMQQFNAKIIISTVISILLAMAGLMTAISIFTATSYWLEILPDEFLISNYFSTLLNILQSALLIGLIGAFAMLIAFYRKSTVMAITMSIILSAIVCNLLSIVNINIISIISVLVFVLVIILYVIQTKKINKLEVL